MRNAPMRFLGLTVVALVAAFTGTLPAGALAPQPVDASEQGPFAFVLMVVMVVLFGLSIFYMDRIRQRREDAEQQRQSAE